MARGARAGNEVFRISDATDKKDAMLIYGGAELRRLEKSLKDPEEGDIYAKLKEKLTDYFTPKKNKHFARYLFLKMRPHAGEGTVSYAARLREKSMNCEFHDSDERIMEHIIQTTDNTKLVRKVLHKKWTLQETLAEMQILEDTSEQVEAIGRQDSNSVSKVGKRKKEKRRSSNDAKATDTNRTCKYCGKSTRCKRSCVLHMENSVANAGNQTTFLQFAYHLERHAEGAVNNLRTQRKTSKGQQINQRQMIPEVMRTQTIVL